MRSLQITPSIETKLKTAMRGDDLPDLTTIKIYEATAVSTRPVRKSGTIWEGAVLTRNTLTEMAQFLNAEGYVPMHVSHDQGEGNLPVGRAFYAEVFDLDDGEAELRTLFYLPSDQSQLITSVENGVLKNLSVGFKAKRMLCSECGWDYLGEDADWMNLFDRVCANDHQIGADGVHIRASGLDLWLELSLVSVGASKDAEIKSRAKSRLSEDQLRQLAASGTPAESVILVATTQGEQPMDLKEVLADLKASAGELAVAKAQLSELTASRDAIQAELTAAKTRISELETAASAGAPEPSELETQIGDLTAAKEAAEAAFAAEKASADSALAFLQTQATNAMIAAGQTDPVAPASIADCISAIEEAKLTIVQTIPVGGVSKASETEAVETKAKPASFDAFKS